MRVVVTEAADGKSRVLRDEEVGDVAFARLWETSATVPLGPVPSHDEESIPEIPPGQTSWRIVSVPPLPDLEKFLAGGMKGIDAKGFHITDTIDYIVVLDGPVTLALDDGIEVPLNPGDLVVQRQTRHAWFNHGEKPVRLLALLHGLP